MVLAVVAVVVVADFTEVARRSVVEPVLPGVVSVAEVVARDWGAVHALLAEVSMVGPVPSVVVD